MPTSDATPIASWPRHLQAFWRDCAERGEVDAQHPPESMIEAYRGGTDAGAGRYPYFSRGSKVSGRQTNRTEPFSPVEAR